MRDKRATGILMRRAADRRSMAAGPRGEAVKLWNRRAAAMIALVLFSPASFIGSRARAQLVVSTNTTISSGTTVSQVEIQNSATLTVTTSGDLRSSGLMDVSGTASSGIGTLNVTGGYVSSAGARLGQYSSSVGTATISSGTWVAGNVSFQVGGGGKGVLNVSGGKVITGDLDVGFSTPGSGTVTISNGGVLSATKITLIRRGRINVQGGTLTSTSGTIGSASGSFSSTVAVSSGTWANSGNLVVGTTGTGTLTMTGGLVVVGGNLTKSSVGTMNLNGGGTLQIGTGSTGGVLLSGTGNLIDNGTLIFNRSNASTYSGVLSGTGAVVKQGDGTLTLSGSSTYSRGTTLTAGTLALGNAHAIGASGTISFGGGTLQSSASNTTDYSARFSNAASQQYQIDTNGENVTLASNLTSTGGSFTKLGAGVLTLAGMNTYSGATTVSAGKLLVNGSLSNSSITIGTGGTLGGSGTLGSLVTVQSGGVLSPGNSPGVLAAAMLDLEAGSTTFMEVIGVGASAGTAGTDYDQVQITTSGGLTYGGSLDFQFGNTTKFLDGTVFDLFAFAGSSVGHFSSVVSSGTSLYGGSSFSRTGGTWTSTIGDQRLTFSELTGRLAFASSAAGVPEIDPSGLSAVLGLIVGGLGLLERRRYGR